MARGPARVSRRWTITAALAAFVLTLVIPAVAALWWSWAAGVAAALVVVVSASARGRRRLSPVGAAGSGR